MSVENEIAKLERTAQEYQERADREPHKASGLRGWIEDIEERIRNLREDQRIRAQEVA